MRGKIWDVIPLRKKVLIYFSVVIVFIGALSVIVYYNMAKTFDQFDNVYLNLKTLEDYTDSIENISADLNIYLSESDRTYISAFYQKYEDLNKKMKDTRLSFSKKEDSILFENIRYMFETYGEEAEAAINEHRKRNLDGSSAKLSRALKIQSYIKDSTDELTLSYISESKLFQKNLLQQMVVLRSFMILLIIMSVLLYVLLALYLNMSIVKPVDKLVQMAERISRGDFQVEPVRVNPHNELKILSDTLFRMSCDIKDYIEEIEEKAEMKSLLQMKEMENLRINALLQEAELKRLQAQVNPHFLFNTITTLHHTAFLEGASETCEIAEAISKILRYNLRRSDRIVKLWDEVENIRHYIYIQRKRYKHRVQVEFDIDESLLDLPIPNMTVQPIVENAFIHGIENNEEGGEISLHIYKDKDLVVVEVSDKGTGIDDGKLTQIRSVINDTSEFKGHTTGLGINNVVKRLQGFYKVKDLFTIESVVGGGTVIKLFLPYGFQFEAEAVAEQDADKVSEGRL
ncbi:sensor histidine kinase [Lutispora sp.]|uniref:sensor histidine kinase n=1 Tax=Lutispora sp. TaxID=2828727 RepID=UPI00356796C9